MPLLIKRFLPWLVLVLAILMFMLLRATRPALPPSGDEERRWPIAVIELQSGRWTPEARLFGQLVSSSEIELRARSAGDVAQVMVRDGDSVVAGQLLLVLDAAEAQATLHQRQADVQDLYTQLEQRRLQQQWDQQALQEEIRLLEVAERQYQRQQQLVAADHAAVRQLEEAAQSLSQQRLLRLQREFSLATYPAHIEQLEAQLRRAQAQLALAQRDLFATRLEAPAALRVQAVLVAPGDRVAAQEGVLRLHRPDAIELAARLPAQLLPVVRQALAQQQPLLAQAEIDGRAVLFQLHNLASVTNDASGVTATFLLIEGDAAELTLGRFVDAHLQLPALEAVFWLPLEAVQGRDRVYRVDDGRLTALSVEQVGQRRVQGQAGVLVRSPQLMSGDQLLATRLPNAMDGLLVEVVTQWVQESPQ